MMFMSFHAMLLADTVSNVLWENKMSAARKWPCKESLLCAEGAKEKKKSTKTQMNYKTEKKNTI